MDKARPRGIKIDKAYRTITGNIKKDIAHLGITVDRPRSNFSLMPGLLQQICTLTSGRHKIKTKPKLRVIFHGHTTEHPVKMIEIARQDMKAR